MENKNKNQNQTQNKNRKVIVLISTQIWTDNWVSKHWISVLFAKQGFDVYFIEPFRGIVFRGGRFKDLIFGPRTKKIKNVNIVSISTLPGFYKTNGVLRHLYKIFIGLQIKNLKKIIGKDYYLITFDGRSLPFIERLQKPKTSAYYCVDPVGYGSEKGKGESQLAKFVDLNIAISESCADDMKQSLELIEVPVLPHGMLFENKLNTDKEKIYEGEIDKLQKQTNKIIGYTGSIHDSYVNYKFIEKAIKKFKHCHWIFIGPYKNSDIANDSTNAIKPLLDNSQTSFLGNRPVWSLASYIQQFDVCLIPYRHDLSKNGWERRSPVKILHYLRQGKPVVCADVPGVAAYSELIYTYKSYDEFKNALKNALEEKYNDPIRMKRIEFTKSREADVILDSLKAILGIYS
jgi:glycosyltransferase involved in cell wall biosynthesis